MFVMTVINSTFCNRRRDFLELLALSLRECVSAISRSAKPFVFLCFVPPRTLFVILIQLSENILLREVQRSSALPCEVSQEACIRSLMCACLRDKDAANLGRGIRHLWAHIPQLNVSRGETHYETPLSPWVWIKHVTGACAFKCALITPGMSPVYSVKWNCIETGEQVSPQRSGVIPRGCGEEPMDHSLTLANPSVIHRGNPSGKKITRCGLKVDVSYEVHMCCCLGPRIWKASLQEVNWKY